MKVKTRVTLIYNMLLVAILQIVLLMRGALGKTIQKKIIMWTHAQIGPADQDYDYSSELKGVVKVGHQETLDKSKYYKVYFLDVDWNEDLIKDKYVGSWYNFYMYIRWWGWTGLVYFWIDGIRILIDKGFHTFIFRFWKFLSVYSLLMGILTWASKKTYACQEMVSNYLCDIGFAWNREIVSPYIGELKLDTHRDSTLVAFKLPDPGDINGPPIEFSYDDYEKMNDLMENKIGKNRD